MVIKQQQLYECVKKTVFETEVFDIHTHLFSVEFDELFLCGIDEILTYHYLLAELFRTNSTKPAEFYGLPKQQQADMVWEELFIKRTPVSESCLSVLTILNEIEIPVNKDLNKIRHSFDELLKMGKEEYFSFVLEKAKVKTVVMTNDALDPNETKYWDKEVFKNDKVKSSLRLDSFLLDGNKDKKDILKKSIELTQPLYLALSLTDEIPEFLTKTVLPIASEYNLPVTLMLGVKRSINPEYQLAGDGVVKFDISLLEQLLRNYNDNKFLVTMLSRENQHELCVLARKFSNLTPFGCWWFLNNQSIVKEISSMRTEMLGFSYIPQHSDARVLEHLISKWKHFREIFVEVLYLQYSKVVERGWNVTEEDIKKDVERLFSYAQ